MTKSQAREKLAREITRLTGQITEDGSIKNGTVTFGWFVRNRYLPLKEADWREETAKVKKILIKADLIEPFEDVRLENFDKFTLSSASINWPKLIPRTECCRSDLTCGLSLPRQSTRTFSPRTLRVWSDLLRTCGRSTRRR
jgi:hypothetical protein